MKRCLLGVSFLLLMGCGSDATPASGPAVDAGTDAPVEAGPSGPCSGVPTTGRCFGASAIQSCMVSHAGEEPQIVEVECPAGLACVEDTSGARCAPIGGCVEGASECADSTTVRRCENGAWVEATCAECVGGVSGVTCLAQAPTSTGIFVSGVALYEALRPKADYSTYDPIPVSLPAEGAYIVVVDDPTNEQTLLGAGVADATGKFSFELDKAPSSEAWIAILPLELAPSGDLALTLLIPESEELLYQRTHDFWQFTYLLCQGPADCTSTSIDIGPLNITLNDGSGAMHIFEILHRGMAHVRSIFPNVAQPTLAAFWSDEQEWSCGDCYLGQNYGGATYVISPTAVERWDASILISGGILRPSQWSDSFIGHELGHFVMESYSLSPTEGGVHSFNKPNTPAMAYREGWPTFFGQVLASLGGEPNPNVFWQQQGKPHKLDLELVELDGATLPLPNPTGPIDQPLSEGVVAAILWSLWAPSHALEPQSLGDGPLFAALRHKRLLFGPNRGYAGPDLVDSLDSTFCLPTESTKVAAAANAINYPWKVAEAVCPP